MIGVHLRAPIRVRVPVHATRALDRALVAVSGVDKGDRYVDDNYEVWFYEKRGTVGDVEQHGFTAAYGGVVSPWFSISTFGLDINAHDKINPWIDGYAASHKTKDDGGGEIDWWDVEDEPKKPGTPGYVPTPGTILPKSKARIDGAPSGTLALFVLLGAIGAGLLAMRFLST